MPIYDYTDTRTGKTVTLYRSIAERDRLPKHLKRQCIADHTWVWKGVRNPADVDRAVPLALRQMEETMGREEMEKAITYSKEDLRKIWRDDERPLRFGEKEYEDAP